MPITNILRSLLLSLTRSSGMFFASGINAALAMMMVTEHNWVLFSVTASLTVFCYTYGFWRSTIESVILIKNGFNMGASAAMEELA